MLLNHYYLLLLWCLQSTLACAIQFTCEISVKPALCDMRYKGTPHTFPPTHAMLNYEGLETSKFVSIFHVIARVTCTSPQIESQKVVCLWIKKNKGFMKNTSETSTFQSEGPTSFPRKSPRSERRRFPCIFHAVESLSIWSFLASLKLE
jgi:hypothetical protein